MIKQQDLKTLTVGQAVYVRYNAGWSGSDELFTGDVTKISPTGQVTVQRHGYEQVFRFKTETYGYGNKAIGLLSSRAWAQVITPETYRALLDQAANKKAITEELAAIYDALDALRIRTQPAVKHARRYGYRMSAKAHAEAVALVAEAAKLLAAHTPSEEKED